MRPSQTLRELSCADDYDPNSMPVDRAREYIRRFLTPITVTERVHIRQTLGRVLAQDIVSPFDVPNHNNSAMDGYALRFADLQPDNPVKLALVGTALAGKPYSGPVRFGECVRIMTGAVLPPECNTVVMQEVVQLIDGQVLIPSITSAKVKLGTNTRKAGEDLAKGAIALQKGRLLKPAELGLIASLGINEVAVYRRLRVAFFSTGDELQSIGTPLAIGEIYDSNRYTLYGMLTRLGCEIIDMGVVADVPEKLQNAFVQASQTADVVITSGGVSVGEADYIKQMLDRLGEVLFWKIAMKPGRPLAYGKIGDAHFFGLPGNPVSVMVTFYQFVREALLILMGQTPAPLPSFKVPLATPIKKTPGRTEFQRGILSPDAMGQWTVRVTGDQGSGILSSMTQANCFIILPSEAGNMAAGELVAVQLLEGLI